MDPNFSRKNVFLYHDNPGEAPLIVATVKYIEKHCNISLSHVRVREVQYARPLLVMVCPIVNKTDQDVNALLDGSRDGQDVMVVIVKRALERAKHKDSLAHLSDPLSTTTRNRVGAACTLFFSGKEKFKGYKHENSNAVHEMKRVTSHAIDRKPWSTSFPVLPDGTSSPIAQPSQDHTDSRPLQFVATSAQKQDTRPLQFVQSSAPTQPNNPTVGQQTPQMQPNGHQISNNNQPFQLNPPPTNVTIPQIKIIPPTIEDPNDPFKTPAPQASDATSNPFADDFFGGKDDATKASDNPFADPFMPAKEEKPPEMLNFPKPAAPPKNITEPAFYFFDDTSPLEQDTISFIQEHGNFELKACRRQTVAIVSPLVVFSPCYTIPDADAKSVLGHCRDGDDIYLVVIEPVTSHSHKKQATLSSSITDKIGGYGVLSYSLDTKTYTLTKQNSEMISELREFIADRQSEGPEDVAEGKTGSGSSNVFTLDDFQELSFNESEA